MKIAYIVGSFPSVTETFILNQMVYFIKKGHLIDIYALEKSSIKKIHSQIKQYSLLEKTTYFIKVPRNRIARIIRGFFLFIKNFHRSPLVILKSINILSFKKDIISLSVLYSVIPFIGKKYDIINAHFGGIGIIGSNLKYVGVQGKLVTTFHGYDMSAFLSSQKKNVYRELFKACDLCLPISEFWKNKLLQIGCKKNKIIVHHMAIDINYFKCVRKKNNKTFNILTVGRFVEKKGYEYSIEAIADLIKSKSNIVYTIIGDGPLRVKIEKKIEGLIKGNNIRLLGECDNNELKKIFAETDLFLLPSVTAKNGDMEGIPVVLMEALAFGIPVISTIHSGIPELVKDFENGFLVNEKDISGIKKYINYLYMNSDKREEMGNNGREIIKKHFNVEMQNIKLEKYFIDLIK